MEACTSFGKENDIYILDENTVMSRSYIGFYCESKDEATRLKAHLIKHKDIINKQKCTQDIKRNYFEHVPCMKE